MLKLIAVIFAIVCVAVLGSPLTSQKNEPEIQTTGGVLRGETLSCGIFCSYFSFKGIPYAQPPIGQLRFRAPLPHPGWSGVRTAFEHGPNCPSGSILGGLNYNEDCLTLNIYTKSLTSNLPVMVWIHGGSFAGGSGNALIYGPDYIVDENVILITINYRLGSLGFLSTGDSNAPGNYGLKDAVLALKWIQSNIGRFGGDPNRVTIFGESAGGAFVHYLILSPSARGLFSSAISQSGSALNPWAYQTNPADVTRRFAERLGIRYSNNADLIAQLRTRDFNDLVKAIPGFMEYPIPRGLLSIPFVPCRDPPGITADEVFLPDEPIQLILSGAFNHVPYIVGFNDAESLFSIREFLVDPQVVNTLNTNPHLLIPRTWNVPPNSPAASNIISQIRAFYFRNSDITRDMRLEYAQYNTDLMFAFGIDQTARYHAGISRNPVYYYKFCFDGSLNLIKTVLLLYDYPGAMHGDDIFYMFRVTRIPPPLFPTNSAITTRRRMVRMWTNFAKNTNPTPLLDLIATTRWNRVNGRQQYLRIDETVTMEEFPHEERLSLWYRLQSQHQQLARF